MKAFFKPFRKFLYKCAEDYVTIHAAYSTLFMFLSFFPLAMFVMASLTFLKIDREYLTSNLILLAPEAFHGLIRGIIENSYTHSSAFLLSISAIIAIWSSSSGVYGLMFGLNDVYRTYDTRPYIVRRLLCIFYTLVLVIMVSLSLLLLVFGRRLGDLLTGWLPHLSDLFSLIRSLKYPLVFLILTFTFNLIYYVFPHIRSGYFSHFPGAAFSSAGWLLLSYFYSIYVNSQYVFTLYGSLATVILFLFWLFLLMCIVFLGGEINALRLDRIYGRGTNGFRQMHLEQIRDVEEHSGRKLTAAERYVLRKSTTRQREMARMKEEEKDRQYLE